MTYQPTSPRIEDTEETYVALTLTTCHQAVNRNVSQQENGCAMR